MKGAENIPALDPGLAWGLEPLCLLFSVLHLFELFFSPDFSHGSSTFMIWAVFVLLTVFFPVTHDTRMHGYAFAHAWVSLKRKCYILIINGTLAALVINRKWS